jgi:hypothetical protein
MPYDAPAAVVGLQIGGRRQELGHFRLNGLAQKRPLASRRTSVSRSVKIRG